MKSTILCVFLIFCSFKFSYNQNWEHYFGDNNQYNISKDLLEDYDYGYLLLGRNYYEEDNEWVSEASLIKTDINGNMLWNKTLVNYYQSIHGMAISSTIDGGKVICGTIKTSYTYYPLIVKLNACGGKEWCRRIPGAVEELPWAEDVLELPNGDIILLVNMFGKDPYETMHLFKIDADGNMLWQYPYCNGYEHDVLSPLGESVALVSDTHVIISGSSYWKNPWEPGSDIYWIRPTFTKVNIESGEEEWVLPFGLQDTILGDAYSFVRKEDAKYIGFASDWTDTDTHPLFIEFNINGNLINHKQVDSFELDPLFQGSYIDNGFIIDSIMYLIGIGGDSEDDFPMFNVVMDTNIFSDDLNIRNMVKQENNHWQIFTKKTYDNKIINSATYKEPGNWDIFLTKLNTNLEQDSVYNGTFEYDYLCPFPVNSGYIYLDDCFPSGMDEEIPTPQEYFADLKTIAIKPYPNPAFDYVNFEFKNTSLFENLTLNIYSIKGELLLSEKIISGQQALSLDLRNWCSGVYETLMYSDISIVGKARFIKN